MCNLFCKKSDALNFAFVTSTVLRCSVLISTLFIFQVRPSESNALVIFESKRMNELLLPQAGRYFSCVKYDNKGHFFKKRKSQEGPSSQKCTVRILIFEDI